MANCTELNDILRCANELDASDIHLVAGLPPMVRCRTVMQALPLADLSPEAMRYILNPKMITPVGADAPPPPPPAPPPPPPSGLRKYLG